MKFSAILALTALLSFTSALPTPQDDCDECSACYNYKEQGFDTEYDCEFPFGDGSDKPVGPFNSSPDSPDAKRADTGLAGETMNYSQN